MVLGAGIEKIGRMASHRRPNPTSASRSKGVPQVGVTQPLCLFSQDLSERVLPYMCMRHMPMRIRLNSLPKERSIIFIISLPSEPRVVFLGTATSLRTVVSGIFGVFTGGNRTHPGSVVVFCV